MAQRGGATYTVLGGIVLGLERTEQRLLGTKDLDGGTGALGQVHEGTSVSDETSADELTNKRSQVGCESLHTRRKVCAEVLTVLGEVNDLLSKSAGGLQILLGDLSTHGNLSSGLDGSLNLLRQNAGQIGVLGVCAETHLEDDLGVGKVIVQDLGKLGEVPAVPLLHAHGICVELLVEDIKTGNGLDDHGVNLLGGELELVTGERVGKTEAGRVHLGGDQFGDERGHVLTDSAVDVLGGRVGDGLDGQAGDLRNRVGELGVGDSHCRVLAHHTALVVQLYCAGVQDALVSSLSSCSRLPSMELTLPSVRAAASLRAVTALSNLVNFFSFSDSTTVETSLLSSSPLLSSFLSLDLNRA